MKKILTILLSVAIFLPSLVAAQDEEKEEEKKKDRPIRGMYACSMIIDNPTPLTLKDGNLELIIHHRFTGMQKGLSDLWGIYGGSNIRLALQYGITDKLTVGYGLTKYSMMSEFLWKYAILTQTKKGTVPLSLSYYGNCVIDGRDTSSFGSNYKFTNRLSFFNQLIVARKFNKRLSAQASFAYIHFNAIEDGWFNDVIGASFAGRFKVYNDISAIYEYHQPIAVKEADNKSNPNAALGLEFATSTHAFQVFATTYDQIIQQKDYLYNTNEFDKEGLGFGFNITVKF